jgi:hypothetical protein
LIVLFRFIMKESILKLSKESTSAIRSSSRNRRTDSPARHLNENLIAECLTNTHLAKVKF